MQHGDRRSQEKFHTKSRTLRLRYLFCSLLTENELRGKDTLTSFYILLKNKMGVQNSQLYVFYALEHVSCCEEREDLRALVSFPDPQQSSGVEIDQNFTMRELIVEMDKELSDAEFTKLVEYMIAYQNLSMNADDYPAAEKRTDFYSNLKKLGVISIDSYQDVMSKALTAIQRIDLLRMQPKGEQRPYMMSHISIDHLQWVWS